MSSRATDKRGRSNEPYGYRSPGTYGYSNGYRGASPYGYGSYGYGYGNNPAGSIVEKTLRDYLLIIRERFWHIILGIVLVLATTAVFTFTRLPLYQASALVEIFRRAPTVMQVQQQVMSSDIGSAEDLNTQVNILKSHAIIETVMSQLVGAEREKFLRPYYRNGRLKDPMDVIMEKNRDVVPSRMSLNVEIRYEHPDREMAARVANLFADAYIAYNAGVEVDEQMKAVEELDRRANEQRQKVNEVAAAIQTYREKNNNVSLDERQDIITDSLKDVNKQVTDRADQLRTAESQWNAVQRTRKSGQSLLDLPFIASDKSVVDLETKVAEEKIAVVQLSQRYRAKFPAMIREQRALAEAQAELNKALTTVASQIEANFEEALQNYREVESARNSQVTQSLKLGRNSLVYTNLQRDYEVNERILEQILDGERMRQTTENGGLENQNARIVDRARPPIKRFSPSYSLNFGVGGVCGIGVGLSLAFFVAYLDDRIKSAFDIETIVGLPIVGIIPEVKQLGEPDRMGVSIAKQSDREVTEAFSALMSALQLKDQSKSAQCILVTSTIAGEGKSFITTHLAQTYAAHGEKVVVVDCDLRRPAVNRVFHLENLKGVIDVIGGQATLDEVTTRDVRPNLDVIVTGGRSKNPTQTLNSKEFALMISELRKRYSRVFIDTPPIAIVTDALIVLPQVDGSLYSIYFNKVRRKAAQFCAQRLLETNVPNFGAVLNGLPGGVGGYYYSHYYDKSYKDYYIKPEEVSEGIGDKIVDSSQRQGEKK